MFTAQMAAIAICENARNARAVQKACRSRWVRVSNQTLLCGKKNGPSPVTVADYRNWLAASDQGWSQKPDFIRRRLRERYIEPIEALSGTQQLREKKHGFHVMAVSCLLIETLVSFYRGWETTEGKGKVRGKSARAFNLFFRTEPRFKMFRGKPFYKHVRCGILHQGETTGGWTINRTGPLYDGTTRINAAQFHKQLAVVIDEYVERLRRNEGRLRARFDKKMKAVLENCD